MKRLFVRLGLLLILSSSALVLIFTTLQLPKRASAYHASLAQQVILSKDDLIATRQIATSTMDIDLSSVTKWDDNCVKQRMEIVGIGMGDSNNSINPQSQILTDPNNLNWLLAQVAGREPTPANVSFTSDAGESIILTDPTTSGDASYTFETNLQPASRITAFVNNSSNNKTSRGLILYAKRSTVDKWTSVGKTTNKFVWHGSKIFSGTETLFFPPLTQVTDLQVTAVIVDNDEDPRPLKLIAVAGTVTGTAIFTGPTHGHLLNIIPLTLTKVPTNTDRVIITLYSLPEEKGDSLVLVSTNVSYQCPDIVRSGIYLPIMFEEYEPTICTPFVDKFSSSSTNWETGNYSNVQFDYSISPIDSKYFIHNKKDGLQIVQAPIMPTNKFSISVDAYPDTSIGVGQYGLTFGQATNVANSPAYRFLIDPITKQYQLNYGNDAIGWNCVNTPAPCWVTPPPTTTIYVGSMSQPNHLGVECDRTSVKLHINNQLVWQGILSSTPRCFGYVGIVSRAPSDNDVKAYFDNFEVSCPFEIGSP